MKEFVQFDEELEVSPLKTKLNVDIQSEDTIALPKRVFESIKDNDIIILEDKSLVDDIEITPEKFLSDIEPEISTVHCQDASTTYGEFDPEGYFKRDNLFSEISDDFARMQARINLGIAEAYAMKWGNITGNVIHQEDLYHFVMDNIHLNIQDLINALNTQLTAWAKDIQRQITTKADINSPEFIGIPTVPTPISTSNSGQIANTAWVTEKINDLIYQDLRYFNTTPEVVSWDSLPTTVVFNWQFVNPITSLTINGVSFNVDTTSYSIVVNSVTTVSFRYTLTNGTTRIKEVFINPIVPTYIGLSLDSLTPILNSIIETKVPDNQYLYVVSEKLELELSCNGIIGGFSNEGIYTIKGKSFYVFKSVQSSLGNLKLKIL